MKSKFFIMLFLLILLSGCTTYDPETLDIVLKPGVDTVEVNGEFIDAGARATLNGTVGYRYEVIENTVDLTTVGTYHIIYETSYQGVSRSIMRIISVIDETPPRMMLNAGIDTLYVGDLWIDAGVIVTDNSLLPIDLHIDGMVNTNMPGEYQITYLATDAFGNQSVVIRYVTVLP